MFQWIEEIIDEPVPGEHSTIEEVQDSLKDGIVLCKLVTLSYWEYTGIYWGYTGIYWGISHSL